MATCGVVDAGAAEIGVVLLFAGDDGPLKSDDGVDIFKSELSTGILKFGDGVLVIDDTEALTGFVGPATVLAGCNADGGSKNSPPSASTESR